MQTPADFFASELFPEIIRPIERFSIPVCQGCATTLSYHMI